MQFGRDSVGRTVALVVANDLRHVFQVVFRHHGGDHRVAVIAVKIFGRGNQGYVWTYKAAGEKKGLVLVALEEVDGVACRHPVGVRQIIAFGHDAGKGLRALVFG